MNIFELTKTELRHKTINTKYEHYSFKPCHLKISSKESSNIATLNFGLLTIGTKRIQDWNNPTQSKSSKNVINFTNKKIIPDNIKGLRIKSKSQWQLQFINYDFLNSYMWARFWISKREIIFFDIFKLITLCQIFMTLLNLSFGCIEVEQFLFSFKSKIIHISNSMNMPLL